ncbi:putative abortive infection protein [Emiliania huxleyi CCMP1516]|uniref:CAAX prenyl protease 2/Lysostaphin resistance protein A-like domain-containing protein n=2 Tax=Emiliania huxleyi TaxID=2903 RepID=A0A0D3IED3_EMIH1|nr:putative abortive infection protein [Emiliania huxleyi CCMP1516]EOD09618.1 putative abortive infection protein [Emiliania huxleyi CCMP1516]|eukprot:XP_005762047.1 putative abortive infection protein [Emiliania huxleyi CCMP1516]
MLFVAALASLCLHAPVVQPALPLAARLPSPFCCVPSEPAASPSPPSPPPLPPSLLPAALRHPLAQMGVCLAGYGLHVAVLSRRHLAIGSLRVGLDTLAGLAVLGAAARHRTARGAGAVPAWLLGEVDPTDGSDAGRHCLDLRSEPKAAKLRTAATAAVTLALLYALVALGLPLTRSSMVGAIYLLLVKLMAARHNQPGRPFFGAGGWAPMERAVRWRLASPWLLPVLGGYVASVGIFNLVEPLNQVERKHPPSFGPPGAIRSLLVNAATPCIGAPLFEEVHSRAFVMQALTSAMPLRLALLANGALFGAQHLQAGLVLPLAAMGYFWGVLYALSGNLLVPVAVHALWNSRIFLGSALAL